METGTIIISFILGVLATLTGRGIELWAVYRNKKKALNRVTELTEEIKLIEETSGFGRNLLLYQFKIIMLMFCLIAFANVVEKALFYISPEWAAKSSYFLVFLMWFLVLFLGITVIKRIAKFKNPEKSIESLKAEIQKLKEKSGVESDES